MSASGIPVPEDSLIEVAWNTRPRADYLAGWLTAAEVAVVEAGWRLIEAVMAANVAELPEEVIAAAVALDKMEVAYALRQPELWPKGPPAP